MKRRLGDVTRNDANFDRKSGSERGKKKIQYDRISNIYATLGEASSDDVSSRKSRTESVLAGGKSVAQKKNKKDYDESFEHRRRPKDFLGYHEDEYEYGDDGDENSSDDSSSDYYSSSEGSLQSRTESDCEDETSKENDASEEIDEAWLESVSTFLDDGGMEYFEYLRMPDFPDKDDDSILDFGSATFGMSAEKDEWIEFSKEYYSTLMRITSVIDYWANTLDGNKEEWKKTWDSVPSFDLSEKHTYTKEEKSRNHPCDLECFALDPSDIENGDHVCMIYYYKIMNASVILYDRLVQYYLAGSSINVFTRLVKLNYFRKKETGEYVPELTTTLCVDLFRALQKLRLICRFDFIFPRNLEDFVVGSCERREIVRRSFNYGSNPKKANKKDCDFYELNYTKYFEVIDEFVGHWNSCYVDENFHPYVNLLLDRMALFYSAGVNQEIAIDDERYGEYVKIEESASVRSCDEDDDCDDDGEKLVGSNVSSLETSPDSKFVPNFEASLRMDLFSRAFHKALFYNKKYPKIHWYEFQKRHDVDPNAKASEKNSYLSGLRKFIKLWIVYKLQTANDLLNEEIGNKYQANFVTEFESAWFTYYKREIEKTITYHASKTPKILLKAMKDKTCNSVIETSNLGLRVLLLRNKMDPKLRGYVDWLRLFLALNMFVEGCTKIASAESPFVLHVNQMGINYHWFAQENFPFLYYSGGRYHVYFNGCTVYAHEIPRDLMARIESEYRSNGKRFDSASRREKEVVVSSIHDKCFRTVDICDNHWYLSSDVSNLIDKIDSNRTFSFYRRKENRRDLSANPNEEEKPKEDDEKIGSAPVAEKPSPSETGSSSVTDKIRNTERKVCDAVERMNSNTNDTRRRLFSNSVTDGDTIYDTLSIWICIVLERMRSTELYATIKTGLVKSCDILISHVNNVTKSHESLKKNLNFIVDFKAKTKRIECLF